MFLIISLSRTQVDSSGQHCLDVHVLYWAAGKSGQLPLTSKYHLHIDIQANPDGGSGPADAGSPGAPALQLQTREGRPVRFGALHVRDSDGDQGVYRVRVSVDHGGTLWVNQADSRDVIFYPKVKRLCTRKGFP